jgi:TIR domain
LPVAAGFEYDLFVSYAHLDNVPWVPGGDGWVTTFVRTLESRLKARNRDFRIWSDPQLRTADDYNLAIGQAIAKSAVFLTILSPAYNDSPYCKKELDAFRSQSNPAFGLTIGTLSRMQAMVIEPLPENLWPNELRTTSPFRFYNSREIRLSRPNLRVGGSRGNTKAEGARSRE